MTFEYIFEWNVHYIIIKHYLKTLIPELPLVSTLHLHCPSLATAVSCSAQC